MIQIDNQEYRTVKYYTGKWIDEADDQEYEFTIKSIDDDNEGGDVQLEWTGSIPDDVDIDELSQQVIDKFKDL